MTQDSLIAGLSNGAASAGPTSVSGAIKRASEATGVGFDYLLKTAMRESSLDASARASTSSAAGLFQFIEQTWLGAVKNYGEAHGLGEAAAQITRTAGGKLSVADPAQREQILNLRFDADLSARLAGELAGENSQYLQSRLGRAANSTDLYTAHFLGPAGAVKLLSAGANAKAADLLPAAAKANPHVFFEKGRARSVGQVVASIAESMGMGDKGKADAAPSAAPLAAAPVQEFARMTPDMAPAARTIMEMNTDAPTQDSVGRAAAAASALWAQSEAGSQAPLIAQLGGRQDAMGPSLSYLAMTILQALDPTRLRTNGEGDNLRSQSQGQDERQRGRGRL